MWPGLLASSGSGRAVLVAHLGINPGYSVEKIAEAVEGTRADPIDFNRAMLEELYRKLNAVDGGLRARGYDEDVRRDVEDAIYACERARSLIDGAPDAPARRDAILLSRYALPKLVKSVVHLAEEVDEEYRTRRGGWLGDEQ